MKLTLTNPSVFDINNPPYHSSSYGGNQAWYPKFLQRQSGCGPTTAANQMAYLGSTDKALGNLYPHSTLDRKDFTKLMQELFRYVTPGMMGVNHIDKLADGVKNYAEMNGCQLDAFTLAVEEKDSQRDVSVLRDYLQKAFEADCPIAFLNLSSGNEHRLQNWHWITITQVEIMDDRITAIASDEGHRRTFDLSLWYRTTPMHGGLVYFAAA